MMKSLDQRKDTESNDFNDIMYRRMKNRERQRRYRERKRLAAETKNSGVITSRPTPLPVEVQLEENPNSCVARVHCRRDWKKDARRAHAAAAALNSKEEGSSGSLSPAQTLTNQSQVPSLSYGAVVESSALAEGELQSGHSNCETQRSVPGRRDWKAAARNKKGANG